VVLRMTLILGVVTIMVCGTPSIAFASTLARGSTPSSRLIPFDHHGCHAGVCITLQSRNGHGAFITLVGGNSAYSLPWTSSRTALLMGTSPDNATEVDHVDEPPANGWISTFPNEANRFWNTGTWFCIVNTVWPGKACAEVIA
jgi:hypothetical protein